MFKKGAILFVLCASLSMQAHAQQPVAVQVDADELAADVEEIVADQAQVAEASLDAMTDAQLTTALQGEADRVAGLMRDERELSPEMRKSLADYQAHLEETAKLPAARKKGRVKQALKAVGRGLWTGVSTLGQGVAITAEAITLTSTAPLRFAGKFMRGLVTGVPHRRYAGPWYSYVNNVSYGANVMLYFGVQFFLAGNPILGVLMIAPVIDLYAGPACENPMKWRKERTQNFCKAYNGMKIGFDRATGYGDVAGAAIYRGLAKIFSSRYRHPGQLDTKLCSKKEKKQFRLANRTIKQRLNSDVQDRFHVRGYAEMVNGCVTIQLMQQEGARVADLRARFGDVIDGIAVVYPGQN